MEKKKCNIHAQWTEQYCFLTLWLYAEMYARKYCSEKLLGTDLIIKSKNKVIKYFIWPRVPTSIFQKKKKNYYFKKISYSLTRISIRLHMSFCNSLLYIVISKVVKIGPDQTVRSDRINRKLVIFFKHKKPEFSLL